MVILITATNLFMNKIILAFSNEKLWDTMRG